MAAVEILRRALSSKSLLSSDSPKHSNTKVKDTKNKANFKKSILRDGRQESHHYDRSKSLPASNRRVSCTNVFANFLSKKVSTKRPHSWQVLDDYDADDDNDGDYSRSCHMKSKPKLIEPLDYENVVVKNKTLLQNDPHPEMLLFPHDDISQSTLPRRFRTQQSSVPENAEQDAQSLLVKECLRSYISNWNVIHYKYSAYSGSYNSLPGLSPPANLSGQIFEVDAEAEGKDEESALRPKAQNITKQGWLYKGPDSTHEASIISFTRSFKRRYFYLKQQADTTYILEMHKDDKRLEAKGSIFLDSATNVSKTTKRGKFSFEIQMQDRSSYLLAAESEQDLEDWVKTLKKVIATNEVSNAMIDRLRDRDNGRNRSETFIESLEQSMNPELQKYARETDTILTAQRREGRLNLFHAYPEIQKGELGASSTEENLHEPEVYKEQFGTRIVVRCEDFKLRLQANIAEDGHSEKLSNPEPFFISLALYDAKEGKKISEDFTYDPNSDEIRAMIPKDLRAVHDMMSTVNGAWTPRPPLRGVNMDWLAFPRVAVFSVSKPHPEIFLVAKIQKVLQGSISSSMDPYLRTPDLKAGTKQHRAMKAYCQRLGHYFMPFAWAARPLFRKYSMELDKSQDFVVYKAEGSRMGEDEMIRQLVEMKKPEKQNKFQIIQGVLLKLTVHEYQSVLANTLTSSLVPLKQFPNPPIHPPTLEVEEFSWEDAEIAHPFTSYSNHLYVYPKLLKYDSQKAFPKARNIACYVEVRDSDDSGAVPFKCIRGRPGTLFTTSAATAVLHHQSNPDFTEEVKIVLPTQLHSKHHLVFRFYHVACNLAASTKSAAKKVPVLEQCVGYAWFPLLVNGRVNVGEQNIRVAMALVPGYLSHDQLGKAASTEIRWVEGGKPLFKFNMHLQSTIYTKDQHLHNFFVHCEKLKEVPVGTLDYDSGNRLKTTENGTAPNAPKQTDSPFDVELMKYVKSLHAVHPATFIQFLPTLLSQLFRLLPQTHSDNVAVNTVRVLVHIVSEVHAAKKDEALNSYVKYVFMTEPVPPGTAGNRHKTVHEELAKHLKAVLRPSHTDQQLTNRFLKHSSFFFEILIKSMAQHLLNTGKVKMVRNERFPASLQFHIQTLVQTLTSHIVQKYREALSETKQANTNLATFVKKCLTLMDRCFVYKLINLYIDNFCPGDPKILHEYKFEFLRIVTSHEHYIPLNLPIMRKQVKNYKARRPSLKLDYRNLKHDYTLSDEFRKNHFLTGLLLHEVKLALNEIRDIRKFAVTTLRNMLVKHAFDKRYATKSQQARIASLYLPLISIILENKNRLTGEKKETPTNQTQPSSMPNGDALTSSGNPRDSIASFSSSISMDAASLSSQTSSSTLTSGSSIPMQRNIKDPSVFAIISGQASSGPSVTFNMTENQHGGSSTSLASTLSNQSTTTEKGDRDSLKEGKVYSPSITKHQRAPSLSGQSLTNASMSTTAHSFVVRYDKLDQNEVKDLLLCFLYVVKNLSEDILLGWFNNSSEYDILDFFSILEICLQQFKYIGKKRITSLAIIGDSRRATTLPAGKGIKLSNYRTNSAYGEIKVDNTHTPGASEADATFRAMLEGNLSTEVALIVLDVVCLYTLTFKEQLEFREGDNIVMGKLFDLYLSFLQTSQSEQVQRHAFAALRSFINKFPRGLFLGEANMCGRLCYEILRCCNSRLTSCRSEACGLMYLLMRSNFDFNQQRNFTRVHLQMIITVSQLISDVVGLSNSRFTESLSIINSYANNDKAMQKTGFPQEVKDLTKRIRTVLMATAQMKEHQNDPEMLVDLQYSLAKSYTSTPELRKTWLDSMARIHVKNGNFSEAAHCSIHIAALVAEYLKRRGEFPQGCQAFKNISPNVQQEESGMKDDSGMQDVAYTQEHLTELLEDCAKLFEKAERYELLGDIYRLLIPIYEQKRDFQHLASAYELLHKAYSKVVEVMQSGKRLLGKYFRVAFFGQQYFEEEDGKEYIYKEPKITGLPEICNRLQTMYSQKYGAGNVKLIMDSNKVNPQDLDPKLAYIQVTYVTPYFDERELEERVTDFERSNNLRRFMYETPFTKEGKSHGEIEDQYKRRTILTASHSFPYVKKRVLVVYHREEVLTPIEVAIDEMRQKVAELQEVTSLTVPDIKKLQLKLQGAVSVQVNAGPVAYANAFLAEDKILNHPHDKALALKELFREFVGVCSLALLQNGHLVTSDQLEYHEVLTQNFKQMAETIGDIFGEQLLDEDDSHSVGSHRSNCSSTVFSVISATSSSSAV